MTSMPFPSNQNWQSHAAQPTESNQEKPWEKLNAGELMPMMFQVGFNDGRSVYYAYSDLREIRLRDAGFVQLLVFGVEKYEINIAGRHLSELVTLIGMGRIKSLTESGQRSFHLAESAPSIDRITVEVASFPTPI